MTNSPSSTPGSRPSNAGISAEESWTTRRLLGWMSEAFTRNGLDSPRLFAELLLSHVIGCDRLKLYMDADRPASPLERQTLRDLVGRALKHEPVQYLVGEAWFFGLPLHVDPSVLIPRPSTETIVEQVLLHARAEPGFGGKTGEGLRLVDVCTGSGCIAIALLKQLSKATALACDISAEALALARRNAERHRVSERLDFLDGDLLTPLDDHPAAAGGGGFHYIVANPPYIPDHEWESADPAVAVGRNVRDFEPHLALRAGPDGLQYIRPLISQAPRHLRTGGLLLVETAASTAAAVCEMMTTGGFQHARVANDGDGLPRVAIGVKAG
ncbi:MAG: peptide chain release factor N(5)-glutamine methyltransferase [Phycisphaerales bacterium]|nr:peptide chain release factor N(5)-glutamine methyltransferase [Phycisphaerales bacterium]